MSSQPLTTLGQDSDASLKEEDVLDFDQDDLAYANADVKNESLREKSRLGWLSVILIIANRMIGSGIFTTTTRIIQDTNSVGITFVFWLVGAIATIAGILLYMEFGLTVPLYDFVSMGRKVSVTRNGGELHYLKYIFKKPRFLSTCIYGVAFILLANVAANSLVVGIRIVQATTGKDINPSDNWKVRGIAVLVVTASCLFHGVWRRFGVIVMNVFGVVKILMLLLVFITGLVSYSGVFKPADGKPMPGPDNYSARNAFDNMSQEAYGYADSFLAVVFAFGGFNQANYVLAEIDSPRKKYKWPSFFAVAGVSALYILVNIAYFIVVPLDPELVKRPDFDIARIFFERTYGTLSSNGNLIAIKAFHAFVAVSALGNILVMTYTASRVKQEIAKEGVVPFKTILSRNWSFKRIPFRKLLRLAPRAPMDKTPVAALFLHWSLSVLFILATASQKDPKTGKYSPAASYKLLVSLYSYTIDAWFNTCLGAGLLYLRLFADRDWSQKSRNGSGFINLYSITAAMIVVIVNAFPVATMWAKPTNVPPGVKVYYPWYTIPTVSWGVLGLGVLYYLVFPYILPRVGKHRGYHLKVHRKLFFHTEHDYPVQFQERIKFHWILADEDDDKAGFMSEDFENVLR